ncbi:hypothetical protein KFE25_005337 [Diacronema lutheri]|uniref:protein xylosyltransferase n=1 Tax=Diacronema lutheri TaxID=2081491 RepID=A0A8J5XPF0_DIALT|nr:hypothetical protein KFE25_005337 [Diacronema lutheri]
MAAFPAVALLAATAGAGSEPRAPPARGADVEASASVHDAGGWRPRWLDFEDAEVTAGTAFEGCTAAVRAARASPEPREPAVERVAFPAVRAASPLPGGLRAPVFAFFVLLSRPFADETVVRLLHAAQAPRHLWLLHADLKADAGMVERLRTAVEAHANVHLMATRHRVQWGGFSMVDALLDGIATALYGVRGPGWRGFDYLINLSDTDLLLRTEPELSAFFAPFAAARRSFVGVKTKASDSFRWEMHAELRKLTFLQCGGHGFAVLNATAADLFPNHRRCCYGRSGPIIYGRVPFALARLPADAAVLHGSQWVALHADAAAALLTHPAASRIVRGFRHTFLSDEAVVQTALMAAPELRERLINHNLRHIDWPHGYGNPELYWRDAGETHDGGPLMLTAEHAAQLFVSEAIAARKADPTVDGGRLFALWDAWMAHKKALPAADQRASSYAHSPRRTLRAAAAAAAAARARTHGGGGDGGGVADGDGDGDGEEGTEDEEPLALSQPPIGASLVAERADLSHVRVPPGPGELDALVAAGHSAQSAAREIAAREASLQSWVPHYGHVDNVTHYYLDYFEQLRQHEAHGAAAHVARASDGVPMAPAPFVDAPPSLRAAGERLPPLVEPESEDGAPAVPLATVEFADGARCECDGAPCRARHTCCPHLLGQQGSYLCGLSRRARAGAATPPQARPPSGAAAGS